MTDGFAHEGLGRILLHLSDFRMSSHQWIDEQELVLPEHTFSDFSVSHALTAFPKEGIPFLQLSVMVRVKDVPHQSYWWTILINLGLDDEQNLLCRLWTEAIPSHPYGSDIVSEIYRSALPGGQDGIDIVKEACRLTFDHLKSTLPTLLFHSLGSSKENHHA